MINNKVRKIFSPAAGLMSILMVMGTVSMPVYAADNNIEYVYNVSSLNKDALIGNNVIEQNGVKLTVTSIAATKNKIKVTMELEAKDYKPDKLGHDDLDIRVYMNDIQESRGGGGRSGSINGKILIDEEIENEDGYPEKGIIRIDAVDGKIGLNGTLKIPVDFTEDFKQVLSKDINKSVVNTKGNEVNVEKFVSNALGTSIVVSQQENDNFSLRHSLYSDYMSFLVNVDGNLYNADFPNDSYNKDGKEYNSYNIEELTFDKIKNADKITIRQLSNSMSQEEVDNFYKDRSEEMNKEPDEDENGIKYNKKFDFTDGSQGNINAVREEDKLKIYCSSDSELKSMLMAMNLYAAYTNGEEHCGSLDEKAVYKDKEGNYVAEFDDKEKDKKIIIDMNTIISNSDKYSLGDEMEIK